MRVRGGTAPLNRPRLMVELLERPRPRPYRMGRGLSFGPCLVCLDPFAWFAPHLPRCRRPSPMLFEQERDRVTTCTPMVLHITPTTRSTATSNGNRPATVTDRAHALPFTGAAATQIPHPAQMLRPGPTHRPYSRSRGSRRGAPAPTIAERCQTSTDPKETASFIQRRLPWGRR